jgi:hypothetical protein
MIRIGMLVRVIYPIYAQGMEGRIEDQETTGRWLVRLTENPLNHQQEEIMLSLEESDFEVIDREE